MSIATDIKNYYIQCADTLGLGSFTNVKTGPVRAALVTKIADSYNQATKAGDEELRNAYISALMLLFWGEADKIYAKVKTLKEYSYEDCITVLYECIQNACDYAAWEDGSSNAEQCIRQSIAVRGAPAIIYSSNLDKNIANVNTYSLDTPVNSEDERVSMGDTLYSEEDDAELTGNRNARSIVQGFINKNKVIEGIILDSIAFNDTIKTETEKKEITLDDGKTYKYNSTTMQFWNYRLVQILSKLPDDYAEYFHSKYDVSDTMLDAAINRIRSCNNQKLYKMVDMVLSAARSQLAE